MVVRLVIVVVTVVLAVIVLVFVVVAVLVVIKSFQYGIVVGTLTLTDVFSPARPRQSSALGTR